MKLTQFTISKEVKLSKNYNTICTHVSATVNIDKGEMLETVNTTLNKQLSDLIVKDVYTEAKLLTF